MSEPPRSRKATILLSDTSWYWAINLVGRSINGYRYIDLKDVLQSAVAQGLDEMAAAVDPCDDEEDEEESE